MRPTRLPAGMASSLHHPGERVAAIAQDTEIDTNFTMVMTPWLISVGVFDKS